MSAATGSDALNASIDTTAEVIQPQTKPWYKTPNPLRWGGIPPIPDERIVSPEHKAGYLSMLTFSWITPMMAGYKRQLVERDIWKVNPDRAADLLTNKVKDVFQQRVKAGKERPLIGALYETFKLEFWLSGIYAMIYYTVQILTPFVLRYLIQFATDAYRAQSQHQATPPIAHGIGLVIGILVMQIVQSVTASQYFYKGMMLGGQSRGVLTGLIYEKSMTISSRAKAGGSSHTITPEADVTDATTNGKSNSKNSKTGRDQKKKKDDSENDIGWTNGRISTLMSIDTNRIDSFCTALHSLWATPLACIITLVLLLINLSYSAIAGFALLVIGVPLFTVTLRSLLNRRRAINKITDQRMSLTQEIVQSVRFVKLFGWEPAFLDRLEQIRMKEIYAIQSLLAVRNAINAVSMSLPIFASMLSFITYSLTNHGLEPAQVFSSLALFNSLRLPLNLLPRALGDATDAWSSLKRIESFMLQEDREEVMTWKPEGEHAIELRSASFTREKTHRQEQDGSQDPAQVKDKKPKPDAEKSGGNESTASSDDTAVIDEREPFQLQDVNFKAGRNELIAVIGTVGSGKTSLLAALAGHMRKTNGDAIFGASRAFCPQYAWIQNTSLQNNITFGKELDEDWYRKIIDACALQPDLDILPHGDQTEIGERGITISGGQKQRLNIARAIYSDADIILMDDPLSAVDAHVGRHIFDKAILGLLKGRCIVLATHQLWVLDRCDRIVWMEDGKIQATDTFENLRNNQEAFRTLIETTFAQKDNQAEEDVKADVEADIEDIMPDTNATDRKKQEKDQKATPLMQQEDQAKDSVPWSVYGAYIRASGTMWNAPLILLLLVLSRGSSIVTGLWLSFWISDNFRQSTDFYIGLYAGLAVVQALLLFAFSLMLSVAATNASKAMFRQAMTRVLRAPVSFFDTTPLGRIVNRFSSDVDIMDNNLADSMRMLFITLSYAFFVFILITAYYYYFAIALVPFYLYYMGAASYYRASARQVKRYESVLRSKVVAKFIEGLSGVETIQAYGLKDQFVNDLRSSVDTMNAAYYITFANQRWLTMRLDAIGNLLVFAVGILVVTSRFSVDPSIGGLVLSYILSVVQMLQFSIRLLSEVDKGINSVERLRHYGEELEEEGPLHTIAIRESWPEKGEIIFNNVDMRHRQNLPLALQGLSIHIKGGERVGIVGRTGAGKSSIISALFRLVEISGGSITIDGIDVSRIGLFDLRSRLTIVPQDPVLFQGTVRSNLDPFQKHTDMELWSALRQTGLIPADANFEERRDEGHRVHLDSVVEQDGLNFSLGQRQLMALARALVRNSQIIVCDEATSSVDMESDEKIQLTMAAGFRGKTVLCVAHRLRTIIGYDRICVVDAGQIVQLDTPANLYRQDGGIFRGMCERSGIRPEDIDKARDTIMGFDDVDRH
ncbi:ABC transporter family protein [Truncatella angustata]|uniref:ABC transporter family protein n=1 Tax=Truncatella angustata TaxID=152316 RepID=A0A9P8RGF3_9PEZI|nr:ABC transporter family protein [Truncatella angustata]KAH6645344.1 ABC transporter family protein [Truncatella angustata]